MSNMSLAIEVLQHFPEVEMQDIACLGNAGGFSGACLWKITTASGGTLCLRRWPQAHPTEDALGQLHGLLWHAARLGMAELPAPLPHSGGDSVLKHHQTLFELTPWMPGLADFHARPNAARLANAMTVLARFHAAAQSYVPVGDQFGCSPGVIQRQTNLQGMLHGELDRLKPAVTGHADAEIRERGRRVLELFPRRAGDVLQLLGRAATRQVARQPCIRDVWHDHVLFTGDDVTGLIDFGAMRTDNVACDLARLIGSLVGDSRADWSVALSAYESQRSLTEDEHLLIRAFDQSAALMSGLNWLQWICVEGRRFDDPQRVLARLDENLRRLEYLCHGG